MSAHSRCPNCDSVLEPGAVLCIECGYNTRTGRQLKTRSQRIRHDFGNSPRTPRRMVTATGLTAIGSVLCIGSAVLGLTQYRDQGGVAAGVVIGLGLLLSPLIGCGSNLSVTRNQRGEAILVKNTWICFYPVGANTIRLDDWDALYFDYWSDANDSPQYRLRLGRDRRGTFFTVYQGGDEDQMKEIADAIEGLTGMRFERM